MFEHRLQLLEAKNKDFQSWNIPDWQRDVMRSLHNYSCQSIMTLPMYCVQRLTVSHPTPKRKLPTKLVDRFIMRGQVVPDLQRIIPHKAFHGLESQEHSCRVWYEAWGTHDPKLTVINRWFASHNVLEVSFSSRLFPIDKAVQRLSEQFPGYTFELTYAAGYRGVAGDYVFRDGKVEDSFFETSITRSQWMASGGKSYMFVDELSDPWEYFGLVRPSTATIAGCKAQGLQYDEADAIRTMRVPFIRWKLLATRDQRAMLPVYRKELHSIALGFKVNFKPMPGLKQMKAEAVARCRNDFCPWVVSGERPDVTQSLDWVDNHAVMLHTVNKIRHEYTNYEHAYMMLKEQGCVDEIMLLKQKVSQAISDRLPATKNANNEVMRGRRLHWDDQGV